MNKKKQKSKLSFFQRYKVLSLTLLLFLVVLPVVFIPSVYLYQITNSKSVLFEDKNAKTTAINKQNIFDFEFSLVEIILPNASNQNGLYRFDYTITKLDTLNEISNIKFKVQLTVKNDKYSSISNESTTLTSSAYTKLNVPFNYNMDKTLLPFLKPKGPILHIMITYTENMPGLGKTNKTMIIKLPYDSSQTRVTSN